MNKKFKLYGGLVALFLLGAVIGSLGTGIYIRNKVTLFFEGDPANRRAMIINKLTARLDLTPEQKVEVEAVLEMTQADLMELRRKNGPELRKIMEKRFSLVREKLNEEQQEKLDEIHNQIKHRIERRGGLGPFPGGP